MVIDPTALEDLQTFNSAVHDAADGSCKARCHVTVKEGRVEVDDM